MNGSGELVKWLLGALLAIILTVMGWAVNVQQQRLSVVETRSIETMRDVAASDAHWAEVLRRLERIESKLDATRAEAPSSQ